MEDPIVSIGIFFFGQYLKNVDKWKEMYSIKNIYILIGRQIYIVGLTSQERKTKTFNTIVYCNVTQVMNKNLIIYLIYLNNSLTSSTKRVNLGPLRVKFVFDHNFTTGIRQMFGIALDHFDIV